MRLFNAWTEQRAASKEDLAELRRERRKDFAQFRAEMQQQMTEHRAEMRQVTIDLRRELAEMEKRLIIAVALIVSAVVGSFAARSALFF